MVTSEMIKDSYRILTNLSVRAMEEDGWSVTRLPGFGKSNIWQISKENKAYKVSIRTTRDRHIAFQPRNGGETWKTLGDADYVCVASFDNKEAPTSATIYLVDAKVVLVSFQKAYEARTKANMSITDDFGMWVCIDAPSGNGVYGVGTGFATKENLLAVYPLDQDLAAPSQEVLPDILPAPAETRATSVSDVLDKARAEISSLTGIPVAGITLELRLKA